MLAARVESASEDLGLLGLELEVEMLNHWLEEVRQLPWNFECLVFGYIGLAALEA